MKTFILEALFHSSPLYQCEFVTDRTCQTISLTSTRYLIGQALGGALLSAYTESFGRKHVFIASAFLYSLFCAITGAVVSLPSIMICRFVTGVLSAIPGTVLAGSIEDMFDSSSRILVVYAWNTGANLGLSIGPIMGAYITAELNWYVFTAPWQVQRVTCTGAGISTSYPSLPASSAASC